MKLVLNEADSKEARASLANALKRGYILHTVDIALAEGLNVIWKHTNVIKDLKAEEAVPAVEDLVRVYDGLRIVTAREVAEETARFALTHNVTVYDSLYVAATQKLNGTLYTADQKLRNTAREVINVKLLKAKKMRPP